MIERIMKIMEHEDLIASKFAEEIGIPHSTISHLLAGRNNPSLNLVTKILERFPSINSDWLLFGKGNMFDKEPADQPNLFSEWEKHAIDPIENAQEAKTLQEKQLESIQPPIPIQMSTEKKSIIKIMVFYSDNTYETYSAEKENK